MLYEMDTETVGLSEDMRVEDPARERAAAFDAFSNGPRIQQGSFVASFALTASDEALALSLTKTQLVQLQAECDPSDDVVHGWRRVRGKKGSRVRLWERGMASVLTLTGVDDKLKEVRRQTVAKIRNRGVTRSTGGNDGYRQRETYAVRSSITVHAPLASVMKTLDCSTVTSHRSFTKIMYENLVVDTAVLTHKQLGQYRGDQSPHLGESVAVRWLVCKSPSPLVWDCDFCLVEYSKVHTIDELVSTGDAPNNNILDEAEKSSCDGLRVCERLPAAYKIIRSIETRHCPVMSDSPHNLERVNVPLGGYLLYTTDNEEATDVVFFMSVSYERKKQKCHVPTAFLSSDDRQFQAIQQVLHRLALGVGRIPNAVDAYIMSLQLESLRVTRWIENSDRSECVVCYHQFHPIVRRRHHCRLCGDVICRDCSIHKDVDLPTIGPTTLRICKVCELQRFGRSSMAGFVGPATKQAARTPKRREVAPAGTPKSSLRDARLEISKEKVPNRVTNARRHSFSQLLSCPKPVRGDQKGLVEKWFERNSDLSTVEPSRLRIFSPSRKLADIFGTSCVTPHNLRSPNGSSCSATSPPPRRSVATSSSLALSSHTTSAQTMPLSRSTTKEHQSRTTQRVSLGQFKGRDSPFLRQRHQSSGNTQLDSPLNQSKTTPLQIASTLDKTNLLRFHIESTSSGKDSQSSEWNERTGRSFRSHLRFTGHIDSVEKYEDLLCEMCDRAIDATGAKYAAVSVFTAPDQNSASGRAPQSMKHFLKVKKSRALMKVAPNLKCCEPVLRFARPIATRDAQTYSLDGYAFESLPFVKGPQQAHFYTGVPLSDSKERFLGALAVFDAKVVNEEELRDSSGLLESIARATVARIKARKSEEALEVFMKTSFLRQSEIVVCAHDADWSTSETDKLDDEDVRSTPRLRNPAAASLPPLSASKPSTLKYSKQQMHRLVQQANQTQEQVLQNSMKMHGVSF